MVVTLSVVGSSVVDPHSCPCLCLDALNHKSGGKLNRFNSVGKKHVTRSGGRGGPLELNSCFIDSRLPCKVLFSGNKISKKQLKNRTFLIVNEVAGQYDDSFEDVKTQILNYFTYKAVRTVLNQLYEMNPTQYRWFYDFVVTNKPGDGKRFIRTLGKEKQDLAERVMITRLHLYGKWVKKCDHSEIYQTISDQNLELMRERLMETVIWPSDDNNKEKIG